MSIYLWNGCWLSSRDRCDAGSKQARNVVRSLTLQLKLRGRLDACLYLTRIPFIARSLGVGASCGSTITGVSLLVMPAGKLAGKVTAVSCSAKHGFPKHSADSIRLVAGKGILSDAHSSDAAVPDTRQVHLMASELHQELNDAGFSIAAGQLGDNITTSGLDVLALPLHTTLWIGDARLTVTGLRNPCRSLEAQHPGITKFMMRRDADGVMQRRTGIFATVQEDGQVAAGAEIIAQPPPEPHEQLPVL